MAIRSVADFIGSLNLRQLHVRSLSYGPETQNGEYEEQASDQGDDHEFRPNHVHSGAAIKDRLRKRYEMS